MQTQSLRCVLTFLVVSATAGCDGGETAVPKAGALTNVVRNIELAPIPAVTIAGTNYYSSSKYGVSWSPPTSASVIRYEVRATDQGTNARSVVTTTNTSTMLTALKAATSYRIDVVGCTTDSCTDAAVSTSLTTPPEVWQLQGVGANVAGLARIIPDGNVKLHVSRYGLDAPAPLAGRLLMYYGPLQQNAKGLAAGVTTNAPNTTSSYLTFTSRAGTSGLLNPPSASTLVRDVNTGQGVPLSAALGGRIRLYFEATDGNNRTRILSVDSQDGYTGLDFNSGASTTCSTAADYSAGGGCAPSVVVGVEADAVNGNPRITNARQFKIGYPTQADWRWDGAMGTFMVFTTDAVASCSTAMHNHGYAVWDGARWVVQYEAGGCPKLLKSVQAAHPVHLGGGRYKLYYGDPSDVTGKVTTSQLPFLGPKKLLYADASLTGDPAKVDFEDWEPVSAGRVITFLWPDGSALNATARGYIDDFSIVAPTADLTLQVFYVAITDGSVVPFSAAAILVNP